MARWRSVAASLVVVATERHVRPPRRAYPAKPIKMIVPFTPGSPVDVLARLVTQHLSPRLGQTIVLENRPGAGTTIGTKLAASADPDGYTLMIAATSFVISSVMYPNAGYDPLKSFDAVAIPGAQPAGAGDRAGRAGEDREGIRRLCAGQSGQAQFRLRARHAAAGARRISSRC